jgi:hypothetical protein
VAESGSDKRRITLELSEELLGLIDGMKSQMGFRSRGPMVEQLLREVLAETDEQQVSAETATDLDCQSEAEPIGPGELDESAAIILIGSSLVSLADPSLVSSDSNASSSSSRRGTVAGATEEAGGIQLPGFVRRQARAVKRSLQAPVVLPGEDRPTALALISSEFLQDALLRAQQHWLEIYGQVPTDAVVDAAQSWLARDIWPQSDHSDGRPFSWNLAQQVILSLAPSWIVADPTLERVVTAAGILEDPFGGSSLAVRVPTLITRFVQWHRSRHKRTTSFDAIDQSMTVHGALRLLQLPTVADRPYTLREIRDAYREQAQSHHPDAGGSADAMRRLNEAYQFLKERYRRTA